MSDVQAQLRYSFQQARFERCLQLVSTHADLSPALLPVVIQLYLHFQQLSKAEQLISRFQQDQVIKRRLKFKLKLMQGLYSQSLFKILSSHPAQLYSPLKDLQIRVPQNRLQIKKGFQQYRPNSSYFLTLGLPVYLVSSRWLDKLQNFLKNGQNFPGPCHNCQLLDDSNASTVFLSTKRYLNVYLMPGIQQPRDYQIFDQEKWGIIIKFFGGIQIKRFIQMIDETAWVQVYFLRIRVFFRGKCVQLQESKSTKVRELRERVRLALNFRVQIFMIEQSAFNTLKQKEEQRAQINKKNCMPFDLDSLLQVYDFKQQLLLIAQLQNQYGLQKSLGYLQPFCAFCKSKYKVFFCECKQIYYCDQSCQKNDRPNHQKYCFPLKQVKLPPLPEFSGKINSGTVGLKNLGNTCYLNSVLQILSTINQLNNYFIKDEFINQINRQNPLGTRELAFSYAAFVRSYWSSEETDLSPVQLKKALGRNNPIYKTGAQQDALQLFNFLINGIHQDLNKVRSKGKFQLPSVLRSEQLFKKQYNRRNRSIVSELMIGMYQLIIKCPSCEKECNSFETFIGLPLNINSPCVSIFVVSQVPEKVQRFKVRVTRAQKIEPTILTLCTELGLARHKFRVYRFNQIKLNLTQSNQQDCLLQDESLMLFELDPSQLPSSPSFVLLKLKIRSEDCRYQSFDRMVLIGKRWNNLQTYSHISDRFKNNISKRESDKQSFVLMLGNRVKPCDSSLFFDSSQTQMTMLFRNSTLSRFNSFKNCQLKKQKLRLQDCFQLFQTPQVLDQKNKWFCPTCHQDRRATLLQRLFHLPQYLVISLKRFQVSFNNFDVLRTFVDFPLDLLKIPLKNGKTQCFECIGVVNHYGGLQGGHYTSMIRRGRQWLQMNDSSAAKIEKQTVVTQNAYILLYRKIM